MANIGSIMVNIPYVLENNVFTAVSEYGILQLSGQDGWLVVLRLPFLY